MKEIRKQEMLHYIQEKETVSIKELCSVFQLSLNTVRRYVNELAEESGIQKIYGGVQAPGMEGIQYPFSERSLTQADLKKQISRKAASYICPNDIIYIDSGTTTMHILDYVADDMPFTVITNSLHIINSAVGRPLVNLISLPGALNRQTMSFSGENTDFLRMLSIHKAFMACSGLNLQDGATNSFLSECRNKRIAVQKANQIFLLLDSSKFGASTLMSFCPLEKIDYIISDTLPDSNICRVMTEQQHTIVLCD